MRDTSVGNKKTILKIVSVFIAVILWLFITYTEDKQIDVTINSVDVKNYAASLVNYGFKEGKSSTNETNQFLYVTYNDDNILVKIIYTQSLMNLTIRISESSKEEIDSELGKL